MKKSINQSESVFSLIESNNAICWSRSIKKFSAMKFLVSRVNCVDGRGLGLFNFPTNVTIGK